VLKILKGWIVFSLIGRSKTPLVQGGIPLITNDERQKYTRQNIWTFNITWKRERSATEDTAEGP